MDVFVTDKSETVGLGKLKRSFIASDLLYLYTNTTCFISTKFKVGVYIYVDLSIKC